MKPSVENCMQWVERDKKVIAAVFPPFLFSACCRRGKGRTWSIDEDGNGYIDFLSSASSLNLAAVSPPFTRLLWTRWGREPNTPSRTPTTAPASNTRSAWTSVYPGGAAAKVCFGLCGSDSNDAAVKFARAYTGRPKIITFLNGYHGSTYGAASLTAVSARTRRGMGPFLPEVYSFPFFDIIGGGCRL